MDYTKLYDELYQLGYHRDGTNIGLQYVDWIIENYPFVSILDVGCSQGKAVQQYALRGYEAYGIDISPTAIRMSKKIVREENTKVGSVLEIPYGDKQFDAVVSTDVLEHLEPEDVDKALFELVRVTKTYLFLRISKSVEGRKDWLEKLQEKDEKYQSISNLHLSVHPIVWWKDKIEGFGTHLMDRHEKLLVFRVV